MWGCQRNKQSGIAVTTALQIVLKVNLRPGIEVNDSFLAAFSEHYAFALVEIDVISVECAHFSDTHSRGCQQINHGEITDRRAVISHDLQSLV